MYIWNKNILREFYDDIVFDGSVYREDHVFVDNNVP